MVDVLHSPLRIRVARRPDAVVVELHGSAGIFDSDQLREQLSGLGAETGGVIVLELSGLDFIGSEGLARIRTHIMGSRLRSHCHQPE